MTVNASAGVATFSGLTLNKAGAGATLRASGAGLSSATTGAITVTAATATQLVVTTSPPGSVTAGSGFGLVVTAEDSLRQRRSDLHRQRDPGSGQQPQRCDPRRHLRRQRQRRRGDLLGSDARQGRGRCYASGVGYGLSPATTGAINRDGRDGDPARRDDAAAWQRHRRKRFRPGRRGRGPLRERLPELRLAA